MAKRLVSSRLRKKLSTRNSPRSTRMRTRADEGGGLLGGGRASSCGAWGGIWMVGQDYYDLRGVPRGADAAPIKAASRTPAKKHHPDRHNGCSNKEAHFK